MRKKITIQLRLTNKDQQSVALYLKELSADPQSKPLSKEEEAILFTEYKNNPNTRLKNKLIKANLRFVITVAKQYETRHEKGLLADIIQHGNIGLIKAVDRFDVTVGTRFLTYAAWYITQEIDRYFNDILPDIPQPANRDRIKRAIAKCNQILTAQGQTDPAIEELVEEYIKLRLVDKTLPEVTVGSLNRINQTHKSFISSSTQFAQNRGHDADFCLEDTFQTESINSPDYEFNQSDSQHCINTILACLSNRERLIFEMTYGLNGQPELTPEQISTHVGFTRERVGQILRQSIKQLQEQAPKIRAILSSTNAPITAPFINLSQFNS